MGFADRYLQKQSIGNLLIPSAPDPGLHSIIAIPAYNESGLTKCLDSLFSCALPDAPSEVIVLVNSGEHTPQEIIALNRNTHRQVTKWITSHQRPGLTFHVAIVENLPRKHFGAGLARKLVMDEAVRRFNQVDHAAGIILSLDGDTLVEQDYLAEVTGLFDRSPAMDGCSIRFAHPLEPSEMQEDQKNHEIQDDLEDQKIQDDPEEKKIQDDPDGRKFQDDLDDQKIQDDPDGNKILVVEEGMEDQEVHHPAVYDAIVSYELHQRYYLEAVRYTGYPHAVHTVGSAFAVRAGAYCRQGGMSKRQAGEDFYFIQKVAMQGNFSECNTTTVYPSPRPSDRVPFGTGPAIARQLETPGEPFLTYAPLLFQHLHDFYALIPGFFAAGPSVRDAQQGSPADTAEGNTTIAGRPFQRNLGEERGQPGFPDAIQAMLTPLPPLLQHYLETTGFLPALTEIHRNVASEPAFRQRFYRKFNMFWILKYLHFAGEHGVNKVEVGAAARELLERKEEKTERNAVQKSPQRNAARELPERKEEQTDRNAGQGSPQRNAARELPERKEGKVAADDDRKALPGANLRELLAIYRKAQAVPSKK